MLGTSSSAPNPGAPTPSDPRAAAAEAAERRLKAVSHIKGLLYSFSELDSGASKGH